MKLIKALAGILLMWAPSSIIVAQEVGLTGLWQHPEEPVIIEMEPLDDSIQGIVYSNHSKPESVGKRVFRGFRFDKDKQCWQGFVYLLKLGEEKSTCVKLENPDRFSMSVKVGFFSKTVTWQRAVIDRLVQGGLDLGNTHDAQ